MSKYPASRWRGKRRGTQAAHTYKEVLLIEAAYETVKRGRSLRKSMTKKGQKALFLSSLYTPRTGGKRNTSKALQPSSFGVPHLNRNCFDYFLNSPKDGT